MCFLINNLYHIKTICFGTRRRSLIKQLQRCMFMYNLANGDFPLRKEINNVWLPLIPLIKTIYLVRISVLTNFPAELKLVRRADNFYKQLTSYFSSSHLGEGLL